MMKNYFSFYDLPVSFTLNEGVLKKKFYQKSRALHPDYYTHESEVKQEEILKQSAYNNDAYNTLKDKNKRIEYILRMYEVLKEEGNNKLDQMFLMEMMDINEALMELQMDPNEEAKKLLIKQIEDIESNLIKEVEPSLQAFDKDHDVGLLDNVLQYYLKKKYLLRIRDNLDRFVSS